MRETRILVCPLNWGLGHAVRDVALIRRLADMGHEVILAGDGAPLDLLEAEFPELETIRFRSLIRVRYSSHLPAWLKITLLSPFLLHEIFAEHYRLGRIIRHINPGVVISDNRFGLWNRRVLSILITHQLSIRLPGFARVLEYPAYLALRVFIGKFNRCWIPDYPGTANLSGDLSHRYPLPRNAVFIGALSRFTEPGSSVAGRSASPPGDATAVPAANAPTGSTSGSATGGSASDDSADGLSSDGPATGSLTGKPGHSSARPVDLVILLSGPEPQRSKLQKIVLKQVFSLDARCIILQGLPCRLKRVDLTSTVTMYSHLPAAELRNLLLSSENVICRAGYTGIMDLALMQKKALIIPTPGQTEQEYLAGYLAGKGMFLSCIQDELDIKSALEDLSEFKPQFNLPEEDFFQSELDRI